jgi:hypothetical protein
MTERQKSTSACVLGAYKLSAVEQKYAQAALYGPSYAAAAALLAPASHLWASVPICFDRVVGPPGRVWVT